MQTTHTPDKVANTFTGPERAQETPQSRKQHLDMDPDLGNGWKALKAWGHVAAQNDCNHD